MHVSLREQSPSVLLRGQAWGTIRVVMKTRAVGAARGWQVLARRASGPPVVAEQRAEEFVLDRLPLGSYDLFVPPEGGPKAVAAIERAGQVVFVQLAVPPPKSIAGRVLDANQAPVADAWVAAVFPDPITAALTTSPAAVLTSQQGEFQLVGLHPGRYDLAVDGAEVEGRLAGVEAGEVNVSIRVLNDTRRAEDINSTLQRN